MVLTVQSPKMESYIHYYATIKMLSGRTYDKLFALPSNSQESPEERASTFLLDGQKVAHVTKCSKKDEGRFHWGCG